MGQGSPADVAPAPLSPSKASKTSRRTVNDLTHIHTLLWKNWRLKRRHPFATLFEVILPLGFIVLLSALKTLTTDVHVPAGYCTAGSLECYELTDVLRGTSAAELQLPLAPKAISYRFVRTETSLSGILLSMGAKASGEMLHPDERNSKNLTVPCMMAVGIFGSVSTVSGSHSAIPSECLDYVVPYRLGIVPDNAFTRHYFYETIKKWYPRVILADIRKQGVNLGSITVPSLEDSTMFFDTEQAMEDYITAFEYGKSYKNPKIFAALVFTQFPDDSSIGTSSSIEYSIRMNATLHRGGLPGDIPRTLGDPAFENPFSKTVDTTYYSRYATTGFMTLQTLVARFLNCMPDWDKTAKTTTGTCQQTLSTAKNDPQLDNLLFQSYKGDLLLRNVLANALGLDGMPQTVPTQTGQIAQLWQLLNSMDAANKEKLLVPLRQAPQPVFGEESVMPFPVNAYLSSPFYDSVANVFAIFFILSYLYSVSRVLVVLIQEKETRARECMKILGVRDNNIIFSWYITYFFIFFFACVLQTLGSKAGLFGASDPVIIFLFFFLFSMTVLSYGFLVSTMFSRARAGAFAGIVVFFFMYFVSQGYSSSSTVGSKALGCLLSPVALAFGVQALAKVEATGTGMNFANAKIEQDHFRFQVALGMMLFDVIVYTLLGMYLERVMPREFGTTEKWYFPVSPSYWARQFGATSKVATDPVAENQMEANGSTNNLNIEKITLQQQQQEQRGEALVVRNMVKEFAVPGGTKRAVKGVNLSMFKDQITCLLGHNGAGKTTLISMLTGIIAPTEGDAYFRGVSFKHNMTQIRQSLGLCFQHDVLYPELTVEEHLLFYGRVKGYAGPELREVVDAKIKDVGLTEKRHVQSRGLSGGMKRKLSVAISLLGDSSLVFLDEPTSGMDPYSRRSTWEILLNNRSGRVIVLTTHFMDEADILGDRIAIMAEGEVRCCGTSLFLKSRYGAGYNFTLVKNENGCDESKLIKFVVRHVPHANVLSNVGAEIAFQLPLDSVSSFADMFEELDGSLVEYGVLSYGISVTTMEEVFIKVAEAGDAEHQHTLNKEAGSAMKEHTVAMGNGPSLEHLRGVKMFMVHLKALFLKRYRVAKRDRKVVVFSTILPITLLLSGLLLLKGSSLTKPDPILSLGLDKLQSHSAMVNSFYCVSETDKWCASAMTQMSKTEAITKDQFGSPPLYPNNTPVVLGVTYANPPIDPTGSSGFSLRFTELMYGRGFGSDAIAAVHGKQYAGYVVNSSETLNLFGYSLFLNTTVTHGAVMFKNEIDQALYRFMSKKNDVTITVNTHPLPMTTATKAIFGSLLSFFACLFITIAFAFFPASVVVFLVKEKQMEHNSKHQQLVSGVSLPAFWLANYLWDLLMYLVTFIAVIVLIQGFDIAAFTGNGCNSCTSATFPAVILIFALFGLAIAPFTYILSYVFRDHAFSMLYTIIINYALGNILMIVSFVLDVIESSKNTNKYLKYLWRLSPLFCLGNGLLNQSMQELKFNAGRLGDVTDNPSPFDLDVMGWELLYLGLESIVFMAIALGIDFLLSFPKIKAAVFRDPHITDPPYEPDEDVKLEAERVLGGKADNEAIVLKGIRKVYPGNKVAVRNVSFGLPKGECFGYLGINGAGKTTTMNMLTGNIIPTAGSGVLGGFDILTQQLQVRRLIGYCPQFDALFELLSVREHLELFAMIKGVPQSQLNQVVKDLMNQMNLNDFENKLAGTLSGGNKRKLSVAIALIGSPPIIFLDEPSTGMDPVSRRFMWNVIADISTQRKESTIILTTHSMEECEALCTRVGIMVGGRLRCLGSVQHLKNRFGNGLTIELRLESPLNAEVEGRVIKHFGSTDVPNFTRADLTAKCEALGNASWADKITASHSTGYSIDAALERDGFVRAQVFCAWWMGEERFNALDAFLQHSFESARLVERQNDLCRYKLTSKHPGSLKLSSVFRLIEQGKEANCIRNYSVSQTTLEQIFNFFASQQHEEKRVARGMM